jgi:hypothetical protein
MYPSPYHVDALLNRAGKSRVISCHSRDIGVACFLSCNHYRRCTLSILLKVETVAACGSGG